MKKIIFLSIAFLLISFISVGQATVINPQNSDKEGGEIILMNSNSNYNDWRIDNYAGNFRLFHSGTEYVRLQSNGNFGIGTTNPNSMLHIRNTSGTGTLIVQGKQDATIGNSSEIVLSTESGSAANTLSGTQAGRKAIIKAIANSGWGQNTRLGFYTSNGSSIYPIERMTVSHTGNVGIGTANPSAKLEIKAVGDGVEILKLNTERPWVFKQEGTGPSSNLVLQEISGNKFFKIKSYNNTDIYTIQSNSGNTYFKGDMGIGTTDTKGFKLGVKGKIAAEEVKVALYNAWPDFVFENNYKLPTLQEVEHHITEKGHLENIPSAAEVAENGIQLGEMNAKLLQKIEELTLYMIEQNKKTENLIKEVAALKQKNAELEKKMK